MYLNSERDRTALEAFLRRKAGKNRYAEVAITNQNWLSPSVLIPNLKTCLDPICEMRNRIDRLREIAYLMAVRLDTIKSVVGAIIAMRHLRAADDPYL